MAIAEGEEGVGRDPRDRAYENPNPQYYKYGSTGCWIGVFLSNV